MNSTPLSATLPSGSVRSLESAISSATARLRSPLPKYRTRQRANFGGHNEPASQKQDPRAGEGGNMYAYRLTRVDDGQERRGYILACTKLNGIGDLYTEETDTTTSNLIRGRRENRSVTPSVFSTNTGNQQGAPGRLTVLSPRIIEHQNMALFNVSFPLTHLVLWSITIGSCSI